MKGYLSQKKVQFEVRDITVDESAGQELVAMGFTAIPVTVIGKAAPVLGANYRALDEALAMP